MKKEQVKTLLRYPGGKSRAVDAILKHFPKDIKTVVSPFLGGASIELELARRGVNVIGCDSFKELISFWKEVLNDPKTLAKNVEKYHPLSKEKFYELQKKLPLEKNQKIQGALFYVLNRSSFSGSTLSGGMSPNHPRFNKNSIQRLLDFKINNFEVHCKDYKETLENYKNEFLYLDPPYLIKQKLYGIKGSHHNFNHNELAELLKKRKNWILSYNNCPEILEMYKDYKIVYPSWSYGMGNEKESKEVLIICEK